MKIKSIHKTAKVKSKTKATITSNYSSEKDSKSSLKTSKEADDKITATQMNDAAVDEFDDNDDNEGGPCIRLDITIRSGKLYFADLEAAHDLAESIFKKKSFMKN